MELAHTECVRLEAGEPQAEQPRYLPRAIQRALDRILAIRTEVAGGLIRPTKVNQLVLQQLIRCADAVHHCSPIIVRKETLASLLGVSKPTIDRALKHLEQGGWITRAAQSKSRRRGFQVGQIVLSTLAIAYLFPTANPQRKGQGADLAKSGEKILCESKSIHALQESSVSKETASLSTKERHPHSRSVFDESRAQQIEPNLQVLLDYFTPKVINWLKGEATRHGKMLEHIVLATRRHFGRVKNLKRYLLACIMRETDFAAIVQHEATKEAEKIEKVKVEETQKRLQAESVNQLYEVDLDRVPFALVEDTGLVSVFTADPRQPGAQRSGTMPFGEFAKKVLLKNRGKSLGLFSLGEFYAKMPVVKKAGQIRPIASNFSSIKKIVGAGQGALVAPGGLAKIAAKRSASMIFV
jgi:hypothetical protein